MSVTKKLEEVLEICDRLMLWYMAGVSMADRVASIEVARRCGVKPLTIVTHEYRLRWYGHMKRRQGDGILEEAMVMELTRTRPSGRPMRTWM